MTPEISELQDYYERLKEEFTKPLMDSQRAVLRRGRLIRETTKSLEHAALYQAWFAWAALEPKREYPPFPQSGKKRKAK